MLGYDCHLLTCLLSQARVRLVQERTTTNTLVVNQSPEPDRLSCGCRCRPQHTLKPSNNTPTASFTADSPLVPNPPPDVIPYYPEDDTPDVLLDAGARDELNHQQDAFLSHILTLGALPLSVGQWPF